MSDSSLDHSSSPPAVFSPTKKRKREKNSSSEEYVYDGRVPGTAMQTSSGLDTEAYRVGGPDLLTLPFTWLSVEEPSRQAFFTRYHGDLVRALVKHGLSPTAPIIVTLERLRSIARPDAKPEYYAYVELEWQDGCREQWNKYAEAMHAVLQKHCQYNIKVLIADPRAMVTPYSKAVPVGNPVLKTWDVISNKIFDTVTAERSDLLTIDLLVRGKEWRGGHNKEKIKVVITMRYDSGEDWSDSLLQRIQRILSSDSAFQQQNVEVEIIRGYLSQQSEGVNRPFNMEGPPPVQHGDAMFRTDPYLGASICTDTYTGTGTFGCAIELDNSATFGLTNCHVALASSDHAVSYNDPAAQLHLSPEVIALLGTGAALGDHPGAPQMMMPSKDDVELLIEHYKDQRDAAEEDFRHLAHVGLILEDDADTGENTAEAVCSPTQIRAYKRGQQLKADSEALLSRASDLLAEVSTGQRKLGAKVRAFSGLRKDGVTGMILNWALFPLSQSQAQMANQFPQSHPYRSITVDRLQGYSAPKAEEEIFKIGRTTGFTRGFINPAKSLITVLESEGMKVWPTEPSLPGQEKPRLSKAEVVCLVPAKKNTGPFSTGGDSGSAVFDRFGMVMGLVSAGSPSGRVSYMTPVPELIKDIKRLSGAEVVRFAGAGL